MPAALRRFIKSVVPAPVMEWRQRRANREFIDRPARDVFTEYFETNRWKSEESVSGAGSEMRSTVAIRAWLPRLAAELRVRTVLDVPCGDFHWMQHVDLGGARYIGGDIVPALIERNRRRFPGRDFRVIDLTSDELPAADLVICRDALIHFSFADAEAAVANLRRSGARYLLTSTYPLHRRNYDTPTGGARAINLTLDPYAFPEPLECLREQPDDSAAGETADKSIALWRIADLPRPARVLRRFAPALSALEAAAA